MNLILQDFKLKRFCFSESFHGIKNKNNSI